MELELDLRIQTGNEITRLGVVRFDIPDDAIYPERLRIVQQGHQEHQGIIPLYGVGGELLIIPRWTPPSRQIASSPIRPQETPEAGP